MVSSFSSAAPDAPLRLFVVGCSRGGTTLTQRLIAEGLGLASLPETRVFAALVGDTDRRMFPGTHRPLSLGQRLKTGLRHALGRSTGREYEAIGELALPQRPRWSPMADVAADFTTAMDARATDARARGWLEKTPFHAHYLPEITRLVPEAWVVHIIRDGRDTVASIWDAASKYDDPWKQVYDRLERAVDNWNAACACSAAQIGQPRQIFLSYDDLTRAPDAMLAALAERMGVPLIPAEARGTAPATGKPATSHPNGRPADDATGQNAGQSTGQSTGQKGGQRLTSARDQAWKQAAVGGQVARAASKWDSALTPEEQRHAQSLMAPLPPALVAEMAALAARGAELMAQGETRQSGGAND